MSDDEAKANERLAHLTGICPKCGDTGWWWEFAGNGSSYFRYCSCAAGIKAQEEDEGSD